VNGAYLRTVYAKIAECCKKYREFKEMFAFKPSVFLATLVSRSAIKFLRFISFYVSYSDLRLQVQIDILARFKAF
jgi:hypothetical protein